MGTGRRRLGGASAATLAAGVVIDIKGSDLAYQTWDALQRRAAVLARGVAHNAWRVRMGLFVAESRELSRWKLCDELEEIAGDLFLTGQA